jgi:hypothetical protein
MIQIVHVISDLDTGGAERMLAKLVGAVDHSRSSNTAISLTDTSKSLRLLEGLPLLFTVSSRKHVGENIVPMNLSFKGIR